MGIFKAYDIRGVYPDDINEETAKQIGRAAALFLNVDSMVIGRDMRLSSEAMEKAAIEGIRSTGTNVTTIGLASTDAVYFAIGKYGFGGGIQITASHNPPQYNGFKVCREKAIPLSYETGIGEIEKIVQQGKSSDSKKEGALREQDVLDDYKEHVLSFVKDIKPIRIAVDAGNGMMGKMLPPILEGLPVEIIPMYFELDGSFPNHEANPLKAENMRDLQAKVKEEKADLGVAFDGDGDRCIFCDENGEIVSCDIFTALIAKEVLRKEKGATIVYDLRSSWVVKETIEENGGVAIEDRVGHSYMKATMRSKDAIFGGELSGHYYFRDNYYADSGSIALIELLNLLSAEGKKMSEILAPLRRYHATGELNFEVEDKDGKIKELAKKFGDGEVSYLDGITVKYEDWWFNVRKSNTEPMLRLNLESKTKDGMDKGKEQVMELLGQPEAG